MIVLNSKCSIIVSSINSIVLGLSFTSFNFVQAKSESIFTENQIISYDTISALAVSSIFLGGLLFNLFNTIKGEKNLILFSTTSMLVGYLTICFYPNVYLILIARVIIGLGCGCTCFVIPQYIFTLAPDESKGLWCSLHPINMNLGILVGQSIINFNTPEDWIIPYRFINLTLFILAITQLFIIDTKKENGEITTIGELIKNKRSLKSIIVVAAMHFAQHISGIDYISIYLPEILNHNYGQVISIYFLTIPSVIISSFLLNKYGRKYLFLISAGLLSVSSVLMLEYKVIGLIVFLIGYNIGLSNVPWIIPNECTPGKYVAPITKIAIITNWGSAYVLLIIMKKVHGFLGDLAFLIYSIMMMIMVFFTFLYVPETKDNVDFLN